MSIRKNKTSEKGKVKSIDELVDAFWETKKPKLKLIRGSEEVMHFAIEGEKEK